MTWGFDQIARATGGRWLVAPGAGDVPPVGAAIDSREVRPGMLFAAFRGEQVDGHAYIRSARERGAAMALATDAGSVPEGIGMPVLLVDDATAALTGLASTWRELQRDLKVVGITGSNGKTTTCRLMHAAACGAGGLPGTCPSKSFNNAIGVPVTVLNARPGDRVLVCEIGMSTPGEIARRCETARPDAAIITTVAEAHLEGLGSLEAIAMEKASIIAGLPEDGVAVMPAGLPVLDAAVGRVGTRARVIRVGESADADERISEVSGSFESASFTMHGTRFTVPLPGAHNARNAAFTVVVARWLGLDDGVIARGLAAAGGASMRLQREVIPTEPAITVINDAYNANPGSMRAGLAVLAGAPGGGRRVAVLGDMLEMGRDGPRLHAEVLAHARSLGLDGVWTFGPLFADAGGEGERSTDDGAIARLASRIVPGDTVLVKGSRGMRLERLVEALRSRAAAGCGR